MYTFEFVPTGKKTKLRVHEVESRIDKLKKQQYVMRHYKK